MQKAMLLKRYVLPQSVYGVHEEHQIDHKPWLIASWLQDCDSLRQLANKDGASTGITFVQRPSQSSLSAAAASAVIQQPYELRNSDSFDSFARFLKTILFSHY